jgi:signal transduction histidine kinase
VKDNGIGIPGNEVHKIFQPFFKSKKVTKYNLANKGRGLGLSISKRIAESMGGDITVKTVENRGTVVSFKVPCPLT